MSDLEQRFDKVEQQLQVVANNQSSGMYGNRPSLNNDEIDLRELWGVLWTGKWWIICITFLFAVAGVFYALSLPNMYTSEGVYAPTQKQSSGGLSGQYGGLAAVAGISLPGESNSDLVQAVTLLSSRSFLFGVIKKYSWAPLLVAVDSWDEIAEEPIWNTDIYDPYSNKWLVDILWEEAAYKTLLANLEVKNDGGLIYVSVDYFDSNLALKWLNILILELNTHFRLRDKVEVLQRMEYLENKVGETSLNGMQTVLYGMIETEVKQLMLVELSADYILFPVVSPVKDPNRVSPNRKVIVLLILALGFGFSSAMILLLSYFRQKK